jgi:dimethylargininase
MPHKEIKMFSRAIVRKPSRSMVEGITTADLGKPNYELACKQHAAYVEALEDCGLDLIVLDALEEFPDSCFVEDAALLTPHCAILTNLGAPSRRGEDAKMAPCLGKYYSVIEQITSPATVEAGDIMMVGSHFYIGLSARTNEAGAKQMISFLQKHRMSGSMVSLEEVLHLKTGVSYLENNNMLASGEFLSKPEFSEYNLIEIEADEAYAANCIWVNGSVLLPAGFPKAKAAIRKAGYKTVPLDMSEFEKIDGGLSCLSLRF